MSEACSAAARYSKGTIGRTDLSSASRTARMGRAARVQVREATTGGVLRRPVVVSAASRAIPQVASAQFAAPSKRETTRLHPFAMNSSTSIPAQEAPFSHARKAKGRERPALSSNSRLRVTLAIAAAAGLITCTKAGGGDPSLRVEIAPGAARVRPSGTVAFTAAVAGAADPSVQWSLAEAGAGTINGAGLYTAPPHEGVFHVIARSAARPTAVGAVAVEVTSAAKSTIAVAIAPRNATVEAGNWISFSAVVTGSSDTGVIWSVEEDRGCGSVSQEGVYTPPAAAGVCHVVARSSADPNRSDVAAIAVKPALAASPPTAGDAASR